MNEAERVEEEQRRAAEEYAAAEARRQDMSNYSSDIGEYPDDAQ